MRKIRLSVTFLVFLLFSITSYSQDTAIKLYRITAADFTLLRDIESRGISVYNSKPGVFMDIMATEKQVEMLESENIKIEFLADNFRSLIGATLKTGSYDDYHDHQETIDLLISFSEAYPEITKLDTIGFSVLGRAICCLKISDRPEEDEDEIPVLMVGNHHGNEVLSVEATLFQIDFLLNNYGSDQEVTHWIDNMEIWYVPMLNPDGREDIRRTNDNGVDLNRNYSFAHTAGGNHGPNGFSEPETQAIRDLSAQFPPALSLTYHTSGRLVLLPWTHIDEAAPDSLALTYLGNKIAESITFPLGSNTGHYELRQGGDWYFTAGEYCDYMYVTHNTHAYTVEMWTSQTPPAYVIAEVVERNLGGMKTLFREAFKASVTGRITDKQTGQPLVAKIHFPFIDDQGKLPERFSEPAFGRFYKYLEPGVYDAEISAPGYRTLSKEISISADEQMIMDLQLDPAPDLGVSAFNFTDESGGRISGDGDGSMNIGETGGVFITLTNNQPINALGTYLKVSTDNPYIDLITDSLYFGTITYLSEVSSPDTLLFTIADNCPDGELIDLMINISDHISFAWKDEFEIETFTPEVEIFDITIHDEEGNNNGIIDNGENVSVDLGLGNTGRQNISSLILSVSTDDEYFEIVSEPSELESLNAGEQEYTSFDVHLPADAPDLHSAYLSIKIVSSVGYETSITFQLNNIFGLFDDFENGVNGWSHASYGTTSNNHDDWQLGMPAGKAGDPFSAFSGSNCWGTDMGWDSYMGESWNGEYQNDVHNYLVSPPVDCSDMTDVGLRYMRWLNTRVSDIASILVNDQLVWKSPARGHSEQEWTEHLIDISDIADGNPSVRVKFELQSSSANALGGWNIDDFLIANKLAGGSSSIENQEIADNTDLLICYPNPFFSSTTINYRVEESGNVQIYISDNTGKKVATIVSGWKPYGNYSVNWDGSDASGRQVSSGIYFIRMISGTRSEVKALVIAR